MIYFVSYITRINYGAVLIEITRDLGITKTVASLALTASAVSYGVGQIISGYFGDKIKPEKIIFTGLILTAAMNLLIPVSSSVAFMTAVWFINGFAQAMMWPPIVKIMSSFLSADAYKSGCVKVSAGSSIATILIYLIAPLIIFISGWRYVFLFSAVSAIIMCICWKIVFKIVKKNLKATIKTEAASEEITHEKFSSAAFFILILVYILIIIQGSMRDGVLNRMPAYMAEMFNLENEIAILINVIIPIFSIISYRLTLYITQKFVKNEYLCIGLFFAVSAASALILALFGSKNAALAVVAGAALSGTMHGINYLQTCVTPLYFAKFGKVALISGLLNSATYVGSSVSTYGTAVLAESMTWDGIALVWAGICVVGLVLGLFVSKRWAKFKTE